MAIDPTTPLTPIIPSPQAGTAADSVATLQAMARAALLNTSNELGQIVGRPSATPPKSNAPVEQAGQASTQDAGHAADAPNAKIALALQSAPSARLTSETRMARAVRTAAADAVPRQAGLAPLMANVRAVVERPDMPVEVREAGRVLLAAAPPSSEITTSGGLRQAVQRSGVFLEAHMARATSTPRSETAVRSSQAPDLKAALLVFRGALSAWLGRALPQTLDIDPGGEPPVSPQVDKSLSPRPEAQVASTAAPGTSRPLMETPEKSAERPFERPAILKPEADGPPSSTVSSAPKTTQTLSSLAPPAPTAIPAAGPLTATEQSVSPMPVVASTMNEARPSAGLPPAAGLDIEENAPQPLQPPRPAPAGQEEDAIAARFGSLVATPKTAPAASPPARGALSALVQLGLMAEEALREDPPTSPSAGGESKPLPPRGYGAVSPEATRPKVPPPPYADGPMAGQKPTAPDVPLDISTAEVVRRLLKGTSGALARQDLMQIASLPEAQHHHHEVEVVEARPHIARLNLDLPFMTPQGVAVAQFEISHDGGGSGGGAVGSVERTYKARFSIDIEPLGPVHALVTLSGARTRVSLWAERAETIARLRAGEESLGAALRQAELTPEVAVHSGAPPTRGGGPLGHFVDQAS